MYLGGVAFDADPSGHCPHRSDRNLVQGFWHDLRCWGWRTALLNTRDRLAWD